MNRRTKPKTKQMEISLGLDKINPITITENDARDMQFNPDYFNDWYEDEIRKLFNGK